MKYLSVIVFAVFISFSAVSSVKACDSECKLTQVKTYFDQIDKVYKKGSTYVEVNELLNHVHDDVKYEHPEYHADFSKEQWRKAFMSQIEKGSYSDGPNDEARVLNIIYGKNHAAVEYSYGKLDSNGHWKQGTPYFALFGFKEGKISLIREYW